MLPCNFIVEENGGKIEVSAINPLQQMLAIENPKVKEIAKDIGNQLESIIKSL